MPNAMSAAMIARFSDRADTADDREARHPSEAQRGELAEEPEALLEVGLRLARVPLAEDERLLDDLQALPREDLEEDLEALRAQAARRRSTSGGARRTPSWGRCSCGGGSGTSRASPRWTRSTRAGG